MIITVRVEIMNILKTLKKHNKKEKVSFHMPGHKQGSAFKGSELESRIWKFDTTELTDTDCLIDPKDCIKRAEDKATEIYGAEKSFFLVNGATCGILSMFYAAFNEGDKVLICRDCHRSVISAMIITGVEPVYVEPIIHESGFSCGVSSDAIKEALDANENVKGVFITSPTYFGISSDIKTIADVVHEKGALLMVDEAHGAHFPFSDKFPKGAMECGADISVVSLHKSMPCPNQTAVLNLGRCSISANKMKNAINIFQTTSPSYIMMSAMEYASDIGYKDGKKLTDEILTYRTESEYIFTFDDPFKLLLDFRERGYNGYEVAEILENKFGIFSELAIESCVLLMISWGNTVKDFLILEKAIDYISMLPPKEFKKSHTINYVGGECVKTPKEVLRGDMEKVSFKAAEGRISAREVTIFPPCIPIFMPGERILKEHIEIINNAINSNLTITGIDEGLIYVTKEDN